MADPLSIAAGVVQIAGFAGTLIKVVSRFVVDYQTLPKTVQELHDELVLLHDVLKSIGDAFKQRQKQFPFEREHHKTINRIIRSCYSSLVELRDHVPELKDNTGPIQKGILSLEKSIKSHRVQEIREHLNSQQNVLQLSLTTISLGSLWHTHESQDEIHAKIRQLTDEIRSTRLFSGRSERNKNSSSPHHFSAVEADYELVEHEEKGALDDVIRTWRRTADDVATVVSLSDLPRTAFDNRSIPPTGSISTDNSLMCKEDFFDPEPDHEDTPSTEILELKLQANQGIVNRLMTTGIFPKAVKYQRRAIEFSEQLTQAHDEGSSFDKLADMKERLADILLECDTERDDLEARKVLEELLRKEVNQPDKQRNEARRCRLYHKLGNLYYKQGNIQQAEIFVNRAFEGRKKMDPRPDQDVADSAELLIKVFQSCEALDEAGGIADWMRQVLRRPSDSESFDSVACSFEDKLTNAYKWCVEIGLDIGDPNFRFDMCDSEGSTPMHRAIKAENLEVLKDMLLHVPDVDQRDENNSTLLHQAAATRNKRIVGLLLEEPQNANVSILDRYGMSPLHRCQSVSGGVQVAELLLSKCPEVVNQPDNHNKTALFMACQMGNVKMVDCLLKTDLNAKPPRTGANPNIKGPAGCTPLVAAIEASVLPRQKYTIVKKLLKSGANPRIQDRDGRSAIDAASNGDLISSEIKKILRDAVADSLRRGSTSSAATTIETSSSGVTRWSGSR